jgi:hypothetical protein
MPLLSVKSNQQSSSSIAQLFCLFFGWQYMDAVPLATRQMATCQTIFKVDRVEWS